MELLDKKIREDCEGTKGYYFISDDASIGFSPIVNSPYAKCRERIGNRFEDEEKTEQAIEKLEAWQRMKNKGFKFTGWSAGLRKKKIYITFSYNNKKYDLNKDLDLLFGGDK